MFVIVKPLAQLHHLPDEIVERVRVIVSQRRVSVDQIATDPDMAKRTISHLEARRPWQSPRHGGPPICIPSPLSRHPEDPRPPQARRKVHPPQSSAFHRPVRRGHRTNNGRVDHSVGPLLQPIDVTRMLQ